MEKTGENFLFKKLLIVLEKVHLKRSTFFVKQGKEGQMCTHCRSVWCIQMEGKIKLKKN